MSSYNDFLSKIEVDEKALEKDLQNRKREIQRKKNNKSRKLQSEQKGKVNPKSQNRNTSVDTREKTLSSENNQRNRRQGQKTKNIAENNEKIPSQKQQVRKNKEVRKNSQKISAQNRDSKVNSQKIAEFSKVNKNPKTTKDTRKNKHIVSKEDVNHKVIKNLNKNTKIQLRQKKLEKQFDEDKKLVETQTFTIEKDEYEKTVLGTIREQETKLIFLKDGDKLAKAPVSVAFLGAYAFLLSVIMIYTFSQVSTVKMELRKLNAEYSNLTEVNTQLEIKLATAYNIDNIRQRAENELYMNKPEAHQIMYITVVPENYAEYSEMD